MRCDHNSCLVDGNNKPIPEAKQANAVWQITGYVNGRTLHRCQKHFDAFDFLHQAVLAFEETGGPAMSKSNWRPEQVRYQRVHERGTAK